MSARAFGPFDPIYFMDRYGLTAVETGARLALLNAINTFRHAPKLSTLWILRSMTPFVAPAGGCSGLVMGSIETALISLNWRPIDIRRA